MRLLGNGKTSHGQGGALLRIEAGHKCLGARAGVTVADGRSRHRPEHKSIFNASCILFIYRIAQK